MEEKKEEGEYKKKSIWIFVLVIIGVLAFSVYSSYSIYTSLQDEFIPKVIPLLACSVYLIFGFVIIVFLLLGIHREVRKRKNGGELSEEDKNWFDRLCDKYKEREQKEESAQEIIDSSDEEDDEPTFHPENYFIWFFTLLVFTIMFFGAVSVKYPYESNFLNNMNTSFYEGWEKAGHGFEVLFYGTYNVGVNQSETFYWMYFIIIGYFLYHCVLGDLVRMQFKRVKELIGYISKKLKGGREEKK